MKKLFLLISLGICMITGLNCEKSNECGPVDFTPIDFSDYSSVIIVDEKEEDKFLVINSKTEFDQKVFIKGIDLEEYDLSDIDYTKYTLLIGKKRVNQITGTLVSQSFEKECGSNGYVYKVLVRNGMYTALGNFYFGIVIPKTTLKIKFEVGLTN